MEAVLISLQMAEGDLPVELPNYKTMSRYDEVTKKRPEPKAQTLPMSNKALDEPFLGGRNHSKQGTVTSAVKASEDSDSDPGVGKAQMALLEAQKRAERKKNSKARTVDDTLPHPIYAPQLSNHSPHPSPTGFPGPYSNIPWNSQFPVQAAPFATPASPSIMSPTPSDWSSGTGSGNVPYNVTTDSYNDYSFRFTKRRMIRFFSYPNSLLIVYTTGKRKTGKDSSRLDFT